MAEQADVVIAGARCAGAVAAATLARQGLRVIAVDPAHFPSTTVSTHLLFAGGVAELARAGVLERVEKIGAPRLSRAFIGGPGHGAAGGYTPVDGLDYGMCVRRAPLDAALVDTAREAGADVREGHRVTGVLWENGRAVGVRVRSRDGGDPEEPGGPDGPAAPGEYEIRARLVIGADGRRSTLARLLGAEQPRVTHANGRACYYAYYEDPREEWRNTAAMWLAGRELGNAFPCDGGLSLVLLMPPVERVPDFRGNMEAEFERSVTLVPGLAERLSGCSRATKVVSSTTHPSYFRRSSGPGWALIGDAGHFKDPVTAQGIRDAIRFARLLGERAGGVIGDPAALDGAVRAWERRRNAECVHTYHWTNLLGRGDALAPVQFELLRVLTDGPGGVRRVLDVYSRLRDPRETLALPGLLRATVRALAHGAGERPAILRSATEALRELAGNRREARRLILP
ncbi:NAD(P)/FAD-dependent oxidoreductase [Nonomuraea sp. LP-02]|uniref:NAD(P)/FAD-dependent oxidoreductase n=1 Tax=Nonomuraea sp. LP-02 TaxID=3097960 RepID=UPI002E34E00E|nr:NAD(P)/FAD-dependent oxidoreductase [Nonomuraea sp. LP-02]MED7926046.1 NAD(P)/FAD-dependent oxidoreductase [Nonomuraea sp. LP-02]